MNLNDIHEEFRDLERFLKKSPLRQWGKRMKTTEARFTSPISSRHETNQLMKVRTVASASFETEYVNFEEVLVKNGCQERGKVSKFDHFLTNLT
jgi:hypothetical protein